MSIPSLQKVLLTGATGFLGSHLLKELLSTGHEVYAFRRRTSDLWRVDYIKHRVQWFDSEGDLAAPFHAAGGVDHVIHAATSYGQRLEEGSHIMLSNMVFPLRLYEYAELYGAKTFINTDTFFSKVDHAYAHLSGYALSKRQFCEWLRLNARTTRICNVRLEHMYGPRDDSKKFVPYIIEQCLRNVVELELTAGDQERDFIYVSDVVRAYTCMLNSYEKFTSAYTDFELGTGESNTIRHFVQRVAHLTQANTYLRFGSLPYRQNEIMHSKANIETAAKIGWRPNVSLHQGLSDTIKDCKLTLGL
ncbi:MAG: NAD-dependent epimerase/dehydratase family protein [Firmicutes bacterium]|nr:NAD-dependent epimerase/dehydratase family protein [Dethiobacter sp.]MBS3888376.1 NAD-dependent epimerase/dehydratase family protein [Bacillota bacterium]MBS4053190.1 NAD-dependent epimerase/dehydratase family protein [Thermaerobacter sp.]